MQKWIDLLNSMAIDFIEYNEEQCITLYGYDLNTVKFAQIIESQCVKHGHWYAYGQEIFTMADGTEITILL